MTNEALEFRRAALIAEVEFARTVFGFRDPDSRLARMVPDRRVLGRLVGKRRRRISGHDDSRLGKRRGRSRGHLYGRATNQSR